METISLNEESKRRVTSSLNIIKEYYAQINTLQDDIKSMKETISEEVKNILIPLLGSKEAKILVKHIKDTELSETMQEELDTVNSIMDILNGN